MGVGLRSMALACAVAWQATAAPPAAPVAAARSPARVQVDGGSPLALESTAHGPFMLSGHMFRVIVHATRAEWADETSAVAYVVVDGKGQRWFEERLPSIPPARGGFELFFQAAQGKSGQGLLVHTQAYPSVRGAGSSFQLLSVGPRALKALPPARIFAIGEGVRFQPGTPDTLVFTASNPYFAVECPLAVDWEKGLRPRKGAGVLTAIVNPPPRPVRAGAVSLMRGPSPKGKPVPVGVRAGSLVELHQAWGEVELTDGGEVRVAGGLPWLQVSVDGQRGWTRSAEDFEALGLVPAPAGPVRAARKGLGPPR